MTRILFCRLIGILYGNMQTLYYSPISVFVIISLKYTIERWNIMNQLIWKTELFQYDTTRAFVREFRIGKGDLIITNAFIYEPFFGSLNLEAAVIYQEAYGSGEPSDEMFEAMYQDIQKMDPQKRIIGIGGGTVLDLSKLFALKNSVPIAALYERQLPIEKDKELILVPTTCGTGSEVTNISILAFISKNTKLGLAVNELYPNQAVLIPELLTGLPYQFFATSSIDALIHAIESALSPRATPYTEMFSYQAIQMIISGYQKIAEHGTEVRFELLRDFLLASNFAGFAFGTAGCGAIHAMSYPLSGTFHVAHGEANYAIFPGVMDFYIQKKNDGKMSKLLESLAGLLSCDKSESITELDKLLGRILSRKTLKEYGASPDLLHTWTNSVITAQQRLLKNALIPLAADDILAIYQKLLCGFKYS